MDLKTRIAKTRQFVKEHAAEITAVAAVAIAVAARGTQKDTHRMQKDIRNMRKQSDKDLRDRVDNAKFIEQCIKEDRDFTYLPGIGVHLHPLKKSLHQ